MIAFSKSTICLCFPLQRQLLNPRISLDETTRNSSYYQALNIENVLLPGTQISVQTTHNTKHHQNWLVISKTIMIMDRRHDFHVMHNFICLCEKNMQKYTLIHKLACMETNTLHNTKRKWLKYIYLCAHTSICAHASICAHTHTHTHTHNITFWLAHLYSTLFTEHCIMENCTKFD